MDGLVGDHLPGATVGRLPDVVEEDAAGTTGGDVVTLAAAKDVDLPLEDDSTEAGAPRGLTALLDPGMRAFPLPTGMTDAFVSDLRVSDRIDLFWVGRVNGRNSSRLVKSGLEILAIEGRNVTLQVSQTDFADLRVLQSAGSLALTPVALADDEGGDTTIETSIQDVLGIEEAVVEEAPEPEAAPEICTRTERRGVDRVVIEVPCE